MSDNFPELASGMAVIANGFYARGWLLGTSGNLSAVIQREPLRLAMSPSGVDKGELKPDQMLTIDENARIVDNDTSILIDREHLVRFQLTLIDTTRTHRQSERLTLDHRTQIPTRPQQPPARIKPLPNPRHPRRKLREVV